MSIQDGRGNENTLTLDHSEQHHNNWGDPLGEAPSEYTPIMDDPEPLYEWRDGKLYRINP